MFGSKDENKKIVVKLNPLFNKANSAKDVVSGKTFQINSGTELESSEWNRLKDKTWTLDGKSYPLLITDEEIAEVEDNEPSDDYVDNDIEDFASNGSVLQDTEVEEE